MNYYAEGESHRVQKDSYEIIVRVLNSFSGVATAPLCAMENNKAPLKSQVAPNNNLTKVSPGIDLR